MSEKKTAFFLIGILMWGACTAAYANEDGAGSKDLPLSLDEAIGVALHNRLEVAIASRQRGRSAIQTRVANQNFLPQIALSANSKYIHSFDKFSGIEADATLGDQNFHVTVQKNIPAYELNAGLDLTYNLYAGGRDMAGLEEAMALQSAQQYEEAATKVSVSLEVMNAYWSLRKSQVLSRLAERAYLHATKLLLIAETKKSSGLLSDIETEAAALYVKETVLAVADARHDEARNLTKYRVSLGYSPDRRPVSGVSLADDPEKISDGAMLAAADRPEVLKLKAETSAAEARVRQTKSASLPTVDFFANYRMVGRDDDYFKSSQIRSDYYTVGFSVSLKLFDGFKDRTALANAEKEIARLRAEQLVRQLESKQADMVVDKEKLQKEVEFSEERLKLYRLKKQLAEENFRNGSISRIDLLEAEKNYEDYSDKLLISKIDVAVAKQSLSLITRSY